MLPDVEITDYLFYAFITLKFISNFLCTIILYMDHSVCLAFETAVSHRIAVDENIFSNVYFDTCNILNYLASKRHISNYRIIHWLIKGALTYNTDIYYKNFHIELIIKTFINLRMVDKITSDLQFDLSPLSIATLY